jgi:hypothetical protein
MRISRDVLVAVAAVAVLAFSHTGRALAISPRDRHFSSASQGIAVEAPPGWILSQHTGFGDTIVLLLHPDGSRISVSAAATTARDSAALFEQNRKGLVAQKLTPSTPQPGPRGFLMVDIAGPDQTERLRQLYLVRPTPLGQQAVILTLVGRASAFDDHASALEFVATRLTLEDPAPPPTAATAISKGRVVPKLELTDLAGATGGGPGGSPPPTGAPASSASPPASTSGRPTGAAGSTGQLRRHGG